MSLLYNKLDNFWSILQIEIVTISFEYFQHLNYRQSIYLVNHGCVEGMRLWWNVDQVKGCSQLWVMDNGEWNVAMLQKQ